MFWPHGSNIDVLYAQEEQSQQQSQVGLEQSAHERNPKSESENECGASVPADLVELLDVLLYEFLLQSSTCIRRLYLDTKDNLFKPV
jgi:hypothetical protein